MEKNIKRFLSLMLAFVMVFGMMPANVFATGTESAEATIAADEPVAKIGDAEYATLAEAIAAVQNGETIVLLADVAGDVTITQKKNVAFTIDGDGHTLAGTMNINGTHYASDQGQALTIQNLKFIVDDYGIYAYNNKAKYARNVTVDGCTFESAAGGKTGYGFAVRYIYNFTVKNTTGSGLFDFFYAAGSVDGLDVENVTVTDTENAFFMAYGTKLNFTNVTTNNVDYGISIKNQTKNGTATITDCNLSGDNAVFLIVVNPTYGYNLIFTGNTLVDSENWLVVADNDGNIITGEEGNPFNVQKNGDEDPEEDVTIVVPAPDVAEVNGVKYESIQAAVNAAQDGETITVIADHELVWDGKAVVTASYASMVVVVGKSVTIDLNGKKLTVDANKMNGTDLYAVFAADKGGSLTLTGNGSVEATGTAFSASGTTAYCLMMAFEPGTSLVVENGTYTMEAAHDSLIYSGGDECVVINDGNFTLGNVGIGENGKPWIFNCLGANDRNVIVKGGTYNADVANQYWEAEVYIPDGYICEDNGDGTWTVHGGKWIAKNQNTGVNYDKLADAIAAVQKGETIVLMAECDENVTIKQTAGKSFTIDGNGNTYTGTITVNGNKRYEGAETLTIQNVSFYTDKNDHVFINANNAPDGSRITYAHNVTVADSTFAVAEGTTGVQGMKVRQGNKITFTGCTATDLLYLVQDTSGTIYLTVKDSTITADYGIRVNNGNNSLIQNVTLNTSNMGIIYDGGQNRTGTIENVTITGEGTPIYLNKATAGTQTLVMKGTNNIAGNWFEISGTGATIVVDLTEDANLDISNVIYDESFYGVVTEGKKHTITERISVAAIGNKEYKTLQAAVNAAQDGDTVVLLQDIELNNDDVIDIGDNNINCMVNVSGKSITLDMAGHTIDADYVSTSNALFTVVYVAEGAGLKVIGDGTIDLHQEGTVGGYESVYYMFWKRGTTGYLTIVNGTFRANNLEDSMIYTNGDKIVTVEGGTFVLDTVGSGENGFPWIFNTYGKNTNSIVVTGGTYNSDVSKQYWEDEVYIPEGYICEDNGDGTWTVHEGKWIAEIRETGKQYDTLAEAVAAVRNGETIVLLADCDEDVTIKQAAGKSFTIDGDGKTYTGTMSVEGCAVTEKGQGLTIQNVNFVVDGYGIYAYAKNNYARNVTIDNCTFTGTDGENDDYGIALRHVYNIVVKNTTGSNLFDLVYGGGAVTGFVAENVTVTDSEFGIWLSYVNSTAVFKNVTTDVGTDGVNVRNNAAGTVTFEGCKIDSIAYAEVSDTAKKILTLIFNDEVNILTVSEDHDELAAVLNQVNATLTAVEGLKVTSGVEGYVVVYENGVYRLAKIIAENTTTGAVYIDLSDGLKEAVSGETLVLLADTAEDLVLVNAGVTFDLNGHVVKAGNVLSFGIVMDSAESVGGIKIDKDTTKAFTKLQPANGNYLPIYDTRVGMYKFFAYSVESGSATSTETGGVKFSFRLLFENQAGYEVLANTEDSCFDFVLDMEWTRATEFEIRYVMNDATIREYAANAYQQVRTSGANKKGMSATVHGVVGLGSGSFISATPNVVSKTEVVGASDTMRYDIP